MRHLPSGNGDCGDSISVLLPGLPTLESVSRHAGAAEERSALILRLLRQKARRTRDKQSRPFYSIRAVANHFAVPATTVSRIYGQLKDEGWLASVWGSKTFVEPTELDKQLRVRAVVGLPAALTSFCTIREYREFFLRMREALWRLGFATQLLFYERDDAKTPAFAELLLNHKIDVVIWFLPGSKMKGNMARLVDHGIRVITVTDYASSSDEHLYLVSRERALRDGLFVWQREGIKSVVIIRKADGESAITRTMIENCLRERAMPFTFANFELAARPDDYLRKLSRLRNQGIIFPSSELAARFGFEHPVCFQELLDRSRVMLVEGLIDLPAGEPLKAAVDVIEVDWEIVAKRIGRDLVNPARSPAEKPLVFEAKWLSRTPVDRCRHAA